MRHEGKVKIPASGEECPCGAGAYDRFAICDEEKTDGLNLHFDICGRCWFETYAHNEPAVKLQRFKEWGQCQIGYHTEARLCSERICGFVSWVIAVGLAVCVAATIIDRMIL